MEPTAEQHSILDGARGEYLARAMRWIVDWGDAMGARRLVRCTNAHALLPVANTLARGASPATLQRQAAELREACAHPTAPGCLCTVHTLFLTMDPLPVAENDPAQVEVQRGINQLAVKADSLAALGCIVHGVPMVADLDRDPFLLIRTGGYVRVDADARIVEVTRRG
jgi:hypothetical protein